MTENTTVIEKSKNIKELELLLCAAGIPYEAERQGNLNGWVLSYPDRKHWVGDVAENEGTNGMEAFGFGIPHKDVRPWLNPVEAFGYFAVAHNKAQTLHKS